MREETLIDSSVWIEIVRGRADPALGRQVHALLDSGQAALCDPVWLELYQGARGRKELTYLEHLRGLSIWLAFDPECWRQASLFARSLRAGGVNVPTGDLLIFACARRHGAVLLHQDSHFTQMESCLEQIEK